MHGVNRDCPGRRQPKYRVLALFDEVDVMPSPVEITVPQLSRLIGLPGAPALIDVRCSEEIKTASGLIPTARLLCVQTVSDWASQYRGQRVVVYCRDGGHASRGVAAWLRQAGGNAQTLEGGFEAWQSAHQPPIPTSPLPRLDVASR